MFELVIWTQPSGPLCLWQCLKTAQVYDSAAFGQLLLNMKTNLIKMLMMKMMIWSICVVLSSRCALYLEPMWQRCGNFLTIDLKNLSISRRSRSFSYIRFLTRFSSLLCQKAFKFFWVLPNVIKKKTKSMFQKGRIY